MKAVTDSIADIGNISFGVVLYLSMYALLGMQLYRDRMSWEGYQPRANFSNFGWAWITCFQVHARNVFHAVAFVVVVTMFFMLLRMSFAHLSFNIHILLQYPHRL
jgi:hypothetical protein